MSPFNANMLTLYIYYNTFSLNVYYKKITNVLIYNKYQFVPYYIRVRDYCFDLVVVVSTSVVAAFDEELT